jgi:hypothetical protein
MFHEIKLKLHHYWYTYKNNTKKYSILIIHISHKIYVYGHKNIISLLTTGIMKSSITVDIVIIQI